jgi:hypothetical protein
MPQAMQATVHNFFCVSLQPATLYKATTEPIQTAVTNHNGHTAACALLLPQHKPQLPAILCAHAS